MVFKTPSLIIIQILNEGWAGRGKLNTQECNEKKIQKTSRPKEEWRKRRTYTYTRSRTHKNIRRYIQKYDKLNDLITIVTHKPMMTATTIITAAVVTVMADVKAIKSSQNSRKSSNSSNSCYSSNPPMMKQQRWLPEASHHRQVPAGVAGVSKYLTRGSRPISSPRDCKAGNDWCFQMKFASMD